MIKQYILRFILRCCLLLLFLYIYIVSPESLGQLENFSLLGPFTLLHFIWLLWLIATLLSMFPPRHLSMGCRKQSDQTHIDANYDRGQLANAKKVMNRGAILVLMSWLCVTIIIGVLVWLKILGPLELILCSLLFYVADLFCVLFWCPFQSLFMHNRCCVNCRIYNWDRLMIVTPLFFVIHNFFAWSLVCISILALGRWEYAYARYPERFYEGSNLILRCKNCTDHLCRIKRPE